MTQEQITAEEYRAAAKVMRSVRVAKELGGYGAEADWCDRAADLIVERWQRHAMGLS